VPDLPALFRADTGGRKRLAPLLLVALRESELEAAPPLLTVLRTAYLREELRARMYRQILGEVLAALRDHGVEFLVLKGAALAETVYRHPVLRHAHDVDLLVAARGAPEGARALMDAGLAWGSALDGGLGEEVRHPSGLPVRLLRRLYRLSYYSSDLAALRARAVTARIASVEVRVPGRADHLVHAIGHASYCPSRSTLLWATDAWMLLGAPGGVDWDAFLERVEASRLELPVHIMLGYLGRELGAAVPERILDELGTLAARAGRIRRDVALFGARQARAGPPQLSGAPAGEWRQRLDVLRWQIWPSRDYMRWAYGPAAPARLALLYLTRLLSGLCQRLAGSFGQRRARVEPRRAGD
jgi:hypothetical protein